MQIDREKKATSTKILQLKTVVNFFKGFQKGLLESLRGQFKERFPFMTLPDYWKLITEYQPKQIWTTPSGLRMHNTLNWVSEVLILTTMGERGRNRERGRERGLQHFKTDFTLLIHCRFSLCIFLVHLTLQRHKLVCIFGDHHVCLL